MSEYYYEDGINVRTNSCTVIGGGPAAYSCVVWYKFSDEDTTEPVTLSEAKDWCAIDGTDMDTKVTLMISAAREEVENELKISLIQRTVTAKIKPGTNLPYGPVIELSSIVDDDGTDYDDNGNGYTFETLRDATVDLTVTYTAGFETVPKKYKTKVLQQIAYMLENRGDEKNNGQISPIIKEKK